MPTSQLAKLAFATYCYINTIRVMAFLNLQSFKMAHFQSLCSYKKALPPFEDTISRNLLSTIALPCSKG
jgi:hypothetical protein